MSSLVRRIQNRRANARSVPVLGFDGKNLSSVTAFTKDHIGTLVSGERMTLTHNPAPELEPIYDILKEERLNEQ